MSLDKLVNTNFSVRLGLKIYIYTSGVFVLFSEFAVENIAMLMCISLVISLMVSMLIISASRNIASSYPGFYVRIVPSDGGWNIQFPWKSIKFRSWMVRFDFQGKGQGVMRVRLPFSIWRIYVEYPFFADDGE